MTDIKQLSDAWLELKEAEKHATEARRDIEDKLLSMLGIPETLEGTENFELESGYKVKIVGRMTRKVDADKLQELAIEHGLTEHISSLFRWSADINTAVWKASSESITAPLLDAITTKAVSP